MNIEKNAEELKQLWMTLAEECTSSAFESYEWCENYRSLFPEHEYFYVWDENYLLPFELRVEKGSRILTLQGGKGADFSVFLTRSKIELKKIISELSGKYKFDCFFVDRLKLADKFDLTDSIELYFEDSSSCVRENGKFFSNYIKDKVRRDTQRQLKRLQALGDCKFLLVNSENLDTFWSLFVESKINQQKKNKAPSILADETYKSFYKKLSMLPNGHFSVLLLNGEAISFHLGVFTKNEFVYLMPTYLEKYQNYSPGRIHLMELFRWCEARGIHTFDFSVGGEGYKKNFCNSYDKIYILSLPFSLKGKLYARFKLLKNTINKNAKIRSFVLGLKS